VSDESRNDRFADESAILEQVVLLRQEIFGYDRTSTLLDMGLLARKLFGLGAVARSVAWRREELRGWTALRGPTAPDTRTAQMNLAVILTAVGAYGEMVELFSEVVEARLLELGEDQAQTIYAMAHLADALRLADRVQESNEMVRRVLRARGEGTENDPLNLPADPWLAQLQTLVNPPTSSSEPAHIQPLTTRYPSRTESLQALLELERALLDLRLRQYGEQDLWTIRTMSDLSHTLTFLNDLPQASAMQEKSVLARRQLLGDDPTTIEYMEVLADRLQLNGDHKKAVKLCREILQKKEALGVSGTSLLQSKLALALSLRNVWRTREAATLEAEVLKDERLLFADFNVRVLSGLEKLALVYKFRRAPLKARELEEAILKVRMDHLGREHSDTVRAKENLSQTLLILGEAVKARDLAEQAVLIRTNTCGVGDPVTIEARVLLADSLVATGDIAHALDVAKVNADLANQILGIDDPDSQTASASYALVLAASGEIEEGITLAKVIRDRARRSGNSPRALRIAQGVLASYSRAAKHGVD